MNVAAGTAKITVTIPSLSHVPAYEIVVPVVEPTGE